MIKRRHFIQTAFATSTIGIPGLPAFAAGTSTDMALPLANWFVADSRLNEAVDVGEAFRETGCAVLHTDGDVTDLWTNTLAKAWREETGVIAGITGTDVLFVLEVLARDHGMTLAHSTLLSQAEGDLPAFQSWIIVPRTRSA